MTDRFNRSAGTAGLLGFLLACAGGVAGGAEPAAGTVLLQLDAARLKQAAIRTEAVVPATALGADPLQGLRLPGQVVVPHTGIAVVAAPFAGRVSSVAVNAGDAVRAGQLLARMQGPDLIDAQRDYVASGVAAGLARARRARDEQLLAEGLVAQNRVEATRAEAALAEAAEASAGQKLRLLGWRDADVARLRSAADIRTEVDLRSPREGVVLEVDAAPAMALEAGAPIVRVASVRELWLDLQATRAQAALVAPGDAVRVAGCAAPGRVLAAGAQVDAANQTVSVRASLPAAAGCVAPNQYLQAEVVPDPARSAGLLSVPGAALVRSAGATWVFMAADGGYRVVPVELVRSVGGRHLVRGGVKAGDRVAVSGIAALKGAWQGLGESAEEGAP